MANRVELGCAGHFILAARCKYRRHTQIIGPRMFRVSTVGDCWTTDRAGKAERQTLGAGARDWYETAVFRTLAVHADGSEGCGCYEVAEWSEVSCLRAETAGEAQGNHEKMVAAYMALSDSMWEEK